MTVWVCTRGLGWGLLDVVETLDCRLRVWGEWGGDVGNSNLRVTSGDGGNWRESGCRGKQKWSTYNDFAPVYKPENHHVICCMSLPVNWYITCTII